jgi:hypothetical protein
MVERIENGWIAQGVQTDFGAGEPQVCDECWNLIEECTCDDGRDEPEECEDDEEPATLDRMQRLVDEMGNVSAEMHAILNRRGVR